ncbi:hypothetical protein Ddye_000870 [Dipteronia dyeriana]|uniref:RNase H type-1 domain-containing protein n=1 Tax=Dipteronia dyeriana TaxID=168575 RepID=A0AAD9XMF9_9ROSI|nr:hypothetical protein Ddye_000870 [Dipteronia dyeriana]
MSSKVLAKRLRKIMYSIIEETQMAFVPKCQTSDSCVIAEEIINKWKGVKLIISNFNVNGSTIGKPGPSGIGGVLRDFNGRVLHLFSYYIRILDLNTTESWVIKRAIMLVLSNPNLRSHDIMVVSDSKVVVSWVNKGDFGNVSQVKTILEICGILKSVDGLEVVFDSRIFNSFADSLAMMGSSMSEDFKELGDV